MKRVYHPDKGHRETPDMAAMAADELLRQVDLCFVMDATGSMQPYIAEVRKELKSFAHQLSAHKLHPRMAFALVLYRDHLPHDRTFVTRCYQFSENLADVQHALDGAGTGGGGSDGSEAVADGLYDALYTMEWRQGSHKVILLAGDAPPHGAGKRRDNFPGGCPCGHDPLTVAREAQERGIAVFALGIGNDSTMRQSFEQISAAGGGIYVPLNNASTLIDKVLTITVAEFGKVDIDRIVYRAYRPKIAVTDIARTTGLSLKEVEESLLRLRKKEMLQ